MTTMRDDQGLEVADVRPVHRTSGRLKVVGGSGALNWWHFRLALGATLAGAMIGALYGVYDAVTAGGFAPRAALESYGAGAGLGASIGLVLGLVAGLVAGLVDRYLLPQVVQAEPVWVQHRRTRA